MPLLLFATAMSLISGPGPGADTTLAANGGLLHAMPFVRGLPLSSAQSGPRL